MWLWIACAVVFLYVVAILVAKSQSDRNAILAAWSPVADTLSGSLEIPSGFVISSKPARLIATVHEVEVVAEQFMSGNGANVAVSSRLDRVFDLRLKVYEERVGASLVKAFGGQDLKVGDAEFDERYVVKASDVDLARALLSSATTERILACPGYTFGLEDGVVRATRMGLEHDGNSLLVVMETVADLAGGPRDLWRAWTRLAEGFGRTLPASSEHWNPDRLHPIVVDAGKIQVFVDVKRIEPPGLLSSKRTFVRVRAQTRPDPSARFAMVREDETSTIPIPDTLGDATATGGGYRVASVVDAEGLSEIEKRAGRSGVAAILVESTYTTVLLGDLDLSIERVREAIDLAVSTATRSSQGPYR